MVWQELKWQMNRFEGKAMADVLNVEGRQVIVPTDIGAYWAQRYDHDLYRMTVALARALFHDATSAIDVGCFTSGLICEMDWVATRVATDLKPNLVANWEGVPGVRYVPGDAFGLNFPEEPFDLVISNQTVEHLEDPSGFVEKLLSLGRGLLVSTTYEVPFGLIEGHIQDPIDLETFKSWFPCEIDAYFICHHPYNRKIKHIVAYVKDSHPYRKRV